MNPPHPEPLEFRQAAPKPSAKAPISHDLAAWVARKRRERSGLDLRPCDRDQIREQLEDMGGL